MEAPTLELLPSERQRLLEAMTELCATQGYEETTVEQVTKQAGVSREAFAKHFGEDKAACVQAAAGAMVGEVISEISSAYSGERLEPETFIRGIKAVLELVAANPSYGYLCQITVRQVGSDHRFAEIYRTGTQALTVLLERLWQDSSAEARSPSVARAALGATEAVVRREIVAGRSEELPRFLPDFIYTATIPFLGQEEALHMARRGRELLRGTAWEWD